MEQSPMTLLEQRKVLLRKIPYIILVVMIVSSWFLDDKPKKEQPKPIPEWAYILHEEDNFR